jgi:3-oxoacyl-(acyl-carrier-protein) synthase/acyl carrier protein/SAM-dependent methyltransferase
MPIDDQAHSQTGAAGDELSPLKLALLEIRRLRSALKDSVDKQAEPVAIVGMALRLPGGVTSPERFWKALAEGEDLITTIPAERWDAAEYWSADAERPATMYDVHGGFLSDVDAFDAEFFGIHPREAASMDPQQRILLELTWEALERANIDPRSLMNMPTGVYLGLTNSDYGRLLTEDASRIDGYTAIGLAASIAAGRIAYFLGTKGPAMAVDTACSSSLVALHHAVQSLRKRETGLAIVGAANLILYPDMNIGFSRTRMLSPRGRCHTFDASADGYVRSEGCCIVVLKRLSDAVRDEDRILAAIRGTSVNQDGRSAGITAPNGPAQEAVMRAALADAGLEAEAVDYIETHGTGTPLGDPIEVQAIGSVYASQRAPESPLHIGSVKTNLGHTEASAGLTGLIKAVLMLQPEAGLAPHLHFHLPSPQIDWKRWSIRVPTQFTPWPGPDCVRYAAVSSFGFSGTNAHVILSSVESGSAAQQAGDSPGSPDAGKSFKSFKSLLCISAKQASTLRHLAQRYTAFLRNTRESLEDICYTAATSRSHFVHRLALQADNKNSAADMLESWLAHQPIEGLLDNNAEDLAHATTDEKATPLDQTQRDFVAGGSLSLSKVSVSTHKVDLPLTPMQPKRFWFGETPIVKRRRQRLEAWQAMCIEAGRQSRQGPLGWSTTGYTQRAAALERLTRAHALHTLAAAGAFAIGDSFTVDKILDQCRIQPLYRNLVARWLIDLAAHEMLREEGGRFRSLQEFHPVDLESCWRDTERCLADDPGTLAYFRQCGSLLYDVLTGQKSALETLFPNGSFTLAEGIYQSSPDAKYLNPIVASTIRAAVWRLRGRRPVRIIEIGGGTGGTTAAILPVLPSDCVEYRFTDVSELFLTRARRKFSEFPFVEFGLLDVDRTLGDQGLHSGMYDIVVAANVIHAARNLESALACVKALLVPGGLLVLLETTHHQAWFDMTTGLIEGWQHFEDAYRQDHPLLAPAQWQAVLARVGFEEMVALPSADSPAAVLGQHVILAKLRELSEDESLSGGQRSFAAPRAAAPAFRAKDLPNRTVPDRATPGLRREAIALQLEQLPQDAREQAVAQAVRETICSVFQLETPPDELSDRDRLSDLGMDSLIALELRSELSKRLGLEGISSTIAFDTGTVGELVRALAGMLLSQRDDPMHIADTSSPQAGLEPVTAEQLQSMSDEEVEQLLKMRLSKP